MGALSKQEIATRLSDDIGLNKQESKEITELFFDTIAETLACGEHVKLSGFGNFMLRDKTARPGRNPKTKEEVVIAPRRVVTFKGTPKLQARLLQNAPVLLNE